MPLNYRNCKDPSRLGCQQQDYRGPGRATAGLWHCRLYHSWPYPRPNVHRRSGLDADWRSQEQSPHAYPHHRQRRHHHSQRAKECFDRYGVDAIVIGRASFGRPWIFKEVKHYLETGEEMPPLSSEWKLNVLRQEVEDSVKLLTNAEAFCMYAAIWRQARYSRVFPTSGIHALPCYVQKRKEELYRIFNEIAKLNIT